MPAIRSDDVSPTPKMGWAEVLESNMGHAAYEASLLEHPAPSEVGTYIFTTGRWQMSLMKSAENTAASCNRPCPFYMFEHHWTRLQVAQWTSAYPRCSPAELLQGLYREIKQWHLDHPGERPEALRIRLRMDSNGSMAGQVEPTPPLPLSRLFPSSFGRPEDDVNPDCTLVMDIMPTEPTATTMYKTSDRTCYDRARIDAGITFRMSKEVLLYNTDNEVLDGSICTPYFWRNGRWQTPSCACGGQQGTTRRWALAHKLCEEGTIMKDSLQDGEIVWLSNGVRGYFRAKFVANDRPANSAVHGD